MKQRKPVMASNSRLANYGSDAAQSLGSNLNLCLYISTQGIWSFSIVIMEEYAFSCRNLTLIVWESWYCLCTYEECRIKCVGVCYSHLPVHTRALYNSTDPKPQIRHTYRDQCLFKWLLSPTFNQLVKKAHWHTQWVNRKSWSFVDQSATSEPFNLYCGYKERRYEISRQLQRVCIRV